MSISRAFVDDKGLCAVQKFSKAPRELSIDLRLEPIWVIYDATIWNEVDRRVSRGCNRSDTGRTVGLGFRSTDCYWGCCIGQSLERRNV
jgi:hypothetical protein